MNAFSKKPLIVALGAAAAMASGAASAVNVSADYLGQVLIFPYYTVNSAPGSKAFNTLFNIVNTQAIAKAVKVRFREALNSREVLDFNVFLSPNDVWTASVTPTSAGGAQITTSDLSCTLPKFVGVQVPFRSDAYVGDGGGNAITRTAEGYIEVFEMATYAPATATAKSVTHNQAKSPPVPACDETNAGALADQTAPTGGVTGSLVLVNPQVGGSFPVAPTVLDNFRDTAYYADTGSVLPNYSQVNPPVSFTVKGNTAWLASWAPGNDAVTAVLLAESVINEYALDPAAGPAATNWIITMPNKYAYTDNVGATALKPFTNIWNTKTGQACETVSLTSWNREETSSVTDDFSPQSGTALCYEANVLGFSGTNMFGSATFRSITLPSTFPNGWSRLTYNASQSMVAPAANLATNVLGPPVWTATPATYFGLPTIGFAAEAFTAPNILINGVNTYVSFGNTLPHKRTQNNIR